MPQALISLCLIEFGSWMNSLFFILVLWGNKNWPPSMKMKKMETFHIKCGLMGCPRSSLNTPGTGNTQHHPILKLGEFPFPIITRELRFYCRDWWASFCGKEIAHLANFTNRTCIKDLYYGKQYCHNTSP